MIKVGQIYKIDNDSIGVIYNYDEKLPYIDLLFLDGLGIFSHKYFNFLFIYYILTKI